MQVKCDTCFNSRPIISENGIHYACCLSDKSALKCMTGKQKGYIENPMRKKGDCNG